MTLLEIFQQAQELSPEERKELAKLLVDSLKIEPNVAETWSDEEIAEMMRVEPMTGSEIIAAGLTGTWNRPDISDGGVWREEQKQKRRERKKW